MYVWYVYSIPVDTEQLVCRGNPHFDNIMICPQARCSVNLEFGMQATIPLNLMEQNLNSKRGQYQFPFTFELPAQIPPSFAYRYGEIMCASKLQTASILITTILDNYIQTKGL